MMRRPAARIGFRAFLSLLVLCCWAAWPGAARADMTVADFVAYQARMPDAEGTAFLPEAEAEYLEGILSGFAWANYMLILRRDPPLFCVPGYLVVSADMAVPMIRAYIKKNLPGEAAETSQVPLVMVLIDSMKAAFPCKNGKWQLGGPRTVD